MREILIVSNNRVVFDILSRLKKKRKKGNLFTKTGLKLGAPNTWRGAEILKKKNEINAINVSSDNVHLAMQRSRPAVETTRLHRVVDFVCARRACAVFAIRTRSEKHQNAHTFGEK